MKDVERKLAKLGWDSRELHAAKHNKKKTANIKTSLRANKRSAKAKAKKLLKEEEQ